MNRLPSGAMDTTKALARAAFAACLGQLACAPAVAQDFPRRAITLIIPWPAGGATDVQMRMMADLAGNLSQLIQLKSVLTTYSRYKNIINGSPAFAVVVTRGKKVIVFIVIGIEITGDEIIPMRGKL